VSLTTFGPVDERVLTQISACQAVEPGAPAVLCADSHLGYSMPIGGVVGYEGFVSPSAVGYDIACGNAAVRTTRRVPESRHEIRQMMDDIWSGLSFGVGRNNAEKVEDPVLDEIAECHHPAQRGLAQMAANQLGTIGSGNHYVDLFEDEEGWLWIGVHFGSRGFGHKTATWALEAAGTKNDDMMAPPVVIPVASELGALYIDGMERAGRYAYAGRAWVIRKVLDLLGTSAVDTVHNHHNFAWRELHGGRDLWVHRKGATPAFPGQRGFVGGSMGESAVILRGVEAPWSAEALYSTVHGAGRVMSRRQAAGKSKTFSMWQCGQRACAATFPLREFQRGDQGARPACPTCGGKLNKIAQTTQVTPGLVDYDAVRARLADRGIEIRGGGADEAPECYKRLPEVLAYHEGTVVVEHTLRVIGAAMAGHDVVDPFKD
jgi:tRNA-splicing ligase RtcB